MSALSIARVLGRAAFAALILTTVGVSSGQDQWPVYGHDKANTKYAPVGQINAANAKNLRQVWRWVSPDNAIAKTNEAYGRRSRFEGTPLMIGGVLYFTTSSSRAIALDAATGKQIWEYNPDDYHDLRRPIGYLHRGVAYWKEGDDERIIYGTTGAFLTALDAKTGKLVETFGDGGRIDLTKGLRREIERRVYSVTSPPIVVGDVLVVGSWISDVANKLTMPPGDVRGFDVRTGENLWTFHTIPQPGEFGHDTWEGDSWRYTGSANAWSVMSADEELGYVYFPTGAPTNNFYGGHRHGDNLFSQSLVCLDAKTGRRVWHFQFIHHGLWDLDTPAAPNLVEITVGGRRIKAVVQVTKQGFCYVFDRATGEPVWPIEERPVPQTKAPGEKTSPTQPFPTKPPPFERQGFGDDDLIDFTPELLAEARELLKDYDTGPIYSPPTEKGIIQMPGYGGGANWGGAAWDQRSGILYIPSATYPIRVAMGPADPSRSEFRQSISKPLAIEGPQGLPLYKPPYGRITAIDLNRGEIKWTQPNGSGPRDHEALKDLNLPPIGSTFRSSILLTDTLIFNTGTGSMLDPEGDTSRPMLYARDKTTGEVVAEIPIPQRAQAAPMTFMLGGKQYIVLGVGYYGEPKEVVAFALP